MAATSTLAVLSMGSMGQGVGNLLVKNGFEVITNVVGRSEETVKRAQAVGIDTTHSDVELIERADYLLSIVPPGESLTIATRVRDALLTSQIRRSKPLFYLELNAISPQTVRGCAAIFSELPAVKFIDGGIIGGPPKLKEDQTWYRPWIPLAGPHELPENLSSLLNVRRVGDEIGAASGLKMCFASLTKGFTALAIQSFTTAEHLGVVPELISALSVHASGLGTFAQAGIPGCPSKAYRWVREMREIADTFSDAGFGNREDRKGGDLFNAVSNVYRFVAEETAHGTGQHDPKEAVTMESVIADIHKSLQTQ